MAYLVLARKWRPQKFEDLVGQESIARILKNAIVNNKVAHAYIFSGPRGVGKTSSARILAKALNCEKAPTTEPCGKCASCLAVSDGSSVDVSEIDGASNTGVDNIRDLREKVRYAPSGGKFKIYIIDEAHMLSTSAFNALLKTLEEPPPHVIFVLATTEPRKIPPTVLSRCQHLPFRRITGQKIKERLKTISVAEGIKVSDSALEMVARAAEGSMRDSLTILDQIVSFSDDISESDVKDLLGITDAGTLSMLSSAVIEGDRKSVLNIIADLTDTGTDLKAFTKDLLQFVRDLTIAKITGNTEDIIDLSEEEHSAINTLKDRTSEEHLALLLSELIKAEPAIRSALFPRTALEMTLIRLSLLDHLRSIDEALRVIKGGPAASPVTEETGRRSEIGGRKAEYRSQKPSTEYKKTEAKSQNTEVRSKKTPSEVTKEEGPSQKVGPAARTFSSLSETWDAALEKLDEDHNPLASKLRDGNVSFGDGEILITYNDDMLMHIDSVKTSLNIIKKAVNELTGKAVGIKIETAAGTALSRKDLKEKALKDPIVKEALELFEGRILDVVPPQDANDRN